MTYRLTKAQVVEYCREVFQSDPSFHGDVVAKREFFNDFTDSLCKDNQITVRQYETWSNPF